MPDHPVVSFFSQQRIRYISQFLDLDQIKSALDVGCGHGFSSFHLKEHVAEMWGTDRAHGMLRHNPLYPTGKLVQADAARLPFADNSFDLVYGWEFLHHIEKPEEVLAEMR